MLAPSRASEEYRAQQSLTIATLAALRRVWSGMGGDWDASWRTVGPKATAILTAGQFGAARSGATYVPDVLEELGESRRAIGVVRPAAFAGRAADGRSLRSLLDIAVEKSRNAGDLDAGLDFMWKVAETELEDAHRQAIQAATIARPGVGWIRMVNTPCCADCAVLVGRFYRANEGFLRHPHCRCYHLPTADPRSRFATQPDSSEITGLTAGERKALESGADLAKVVNARRGASKMTTTEGTVRGRLAGRQRLTPDAIYRLSSSEDEARALLRRFGYLR